MKTSRRQLPTKLNNNRNHRARPLPRRTYVLTMLPLAKGEHVFNANGEQEWQIQQDTDVHFAVYGT
jgi:hypothetical protein